MRKSCALGIVSMVLTTGAATAPAAVVANYQTGFTTPAPGNGWSYYWNPAGVSLTSGTFPALTPNIASWAPLAFNATDSKYETASGGTLPQANPGGSLSLTSTTVLLGQDNAHAADGFSHYAILAYTFSAADVLNGHDLKFHTYSFNIPADPNLSKVDVEVFRNNALVFVNPFDAPTLFNDGTYGGDYDFGTVNAGDTLYVALGAVGGTYTNQPIGVAYTLALVPEPGTIGLLALAAVPMMLRRRSWGR